jgi:hypothetical protein
MFRNRGNIKFGLIFEIDEEVEVENCEAARYFSVFYFDLCVEMIQNEIVTVVVHTKPITFPNLRSEILKISAKNATAFRSEIFEFSEESFSDRQINFFLEDHFRDFKVF